MLVEFGQTWVGSVEQGAEDTFRGQEGLVAIHDGDTTVHYYRVDQKDEDAFREWCEGMFEAPWSEITVAGKWPDLRVELTDPTEE